MARELKQVGVLGSTSAVGRGLCRVIHGLRLPVGGDALLPLCVFVILLQSPDALALEKRRGIRSERVAHGHGEIGARAREAFRQVLHGAYEEARRAGLGFEAAVRVPATGQAPGRARRVGARGVAIRARGAAGETDSGSCIRRARGAL